METCERLLEAQPQTVERRGVVVREMERRLLGEATTRVRIGRYQIDRLLGSGAQGLVYSGWDPLLGRDVAIKVWTAATNETATLSVLRESRAMAAVTHPNVVRIFDVGLAEPDDTHPFSDRRVAFVVMELFGRGALRTGTSARLPEEDVFAMLEDVARGLDAIADAGLVHRDVKPSNLLRAEDGHVAVGDFGLVVPTQTRTNSDSMHVSRPPLHASGTPMYMAPEQLRGVAVTPRTDQYALAIIAFELLTGRQSPFVHATSRRMLADREAVRIDPQLRGLPVREQSVLRRALDPVPENRYVSSEAFVRALRQASMPRNFRRFATVLVLSALALAVTVDAVRDPSGEQASFAADPGDSTAARVTIEDVTAAVESGSSAQARRLTRQALSQGQEDVVSHAVERIAGASLNSGEIDDAAGFVESIYFEAIERRRNGIALACSTTLASLLLEAHGALEPAKWWLEHARGHLSAEASPAIVVRYEGAQARLATAMGDQPAARLHVEAAFEACRGVAAPMCDVPALYRLRGMILEREGRVEDSVVALRKGLAALEGPAPVRRARFESYLGDLLRQLGRSGEALELHTQSIRRLLASEQHPRSVADARVNLGITLLEVGEVREGTQELELAAAFYDENLPDSSILGEIRANLGAGYALSGDAARARVEFEAGRVTFSELYPAGHPRLRQLALLRAQMMNRAGDHTDALVQSMSLVDAPEPVENPGMHAIALLEAGRASLKLGRAGGELLLNRAIEELEELPAYRAHQATAQRLLEQAGFPSDAIACVQSPAETGVRCD